MSGSLTQQEAQRLDAWLATEGKDESNRLERILDAVDRYPSDFNPDVEKGLARFQDRLEKESKTVKVVPIAQKFRMLWRVAAAVILLLGIGWLLRSTLLGGVETMELLSSEAVVYQELPDGTEVWLRPGSRLAYPGNFDSRQRTVQLQGEAYFDVAHNPAQPFLVQTANSTVKVLGTAFNVRAYEGQLLESVQVFDGLVEFQAPAAQQVARLKKGTGAVYDFKKKQLQALSEVDENAIAWKTGKLRLREAPLSQVFLLIEDHFGIQFRKGDLSANVEDCTFTITLDGFELSNTLTLLEKALNFQIDRETDTTYRISGGACDRSQLLAE